MSTSVTIGQLAKLSKSNTDTLRYYEQQQLISSQRAANGYRRFGLDTVERIQFIQTAKNLGFSLAEIKALLNLKHAEDSTCEKVKNLAQQKLDLIAEKIQQLTHMHNMLAEITEQCCGDDSHVDHCKIIRSIDQGLDQSNMMQEPSHDL